MPRLEVQLDQKPDRVLSGEVVLVQLTVCNTGERGLKHCWFKLSHPSFFCAEIQPEDSSASDQGMQ